MNFKGSALLVLVQRVDEGRHEAHGEEEGHSQHEGAREEQHRPRLAAAQTGTHTSRLSTRLRARCSRQTDRPTYSNRTSPVS